MEINNFLNDCKLVVMTYTNNEIEDPSKHIKPEDVYVVWYSKTLQNAKALLATPVPDGLYFECTYNGDKDEMYFDAYKKVSNKLITDEPR